MTTSDLTVPELEQLARFDKNWRVVLEGDDPLLVWELRKRNYLNALSQQPPLYRLSEKGHKALEWQSRTEIPGGAALKNRSS